MKGVASWLEAIVAEAKEGRAPGEELHVVFYVHGYNTDSREALKRQRLAEVELRKRGFPCLVIGFDWPTGGTSAAYLYDRFQASQTALALVSGGIFPFARFSAADCPIKVHVMAHSMGSYVVREAFKGADDARTASIPNTWSIGQMVLFGADLSSHTFSEGHPDMKAVFAHCGRLTNYFSGYDEALAVSNAKNLDISQRVGRVGVPEDKPTSTKAIDVNCGPRYKAVSPRAFKIIDGMVSHSWYMEDERWYDDLAYTLRGDLDRNVIPTRTPDPGGLRDDFVLKVD
jgi:esterase/lipase superfamily enzyme